jgi:hypothetical protein
MKTTVKNLSKILSGAALLSASTLVAAAAFDGSAPLLCAVTSTASCDSQGACIEGSAEAVNLPVFIKIDVQNKVAQSTRVGGEQRTSEILSAQSDGGSLVLLGVDEGAGWSVAIGEESGKMTLAVSGEGIGYLAFGACTPH